MRIVLLVNIQFRSAGQMVGAGGKREWKMGIFTNRVFAGICDNSIFMCCCSIICDDRADSINLCVRRVGSNYINGEASGSIIRIRLRAANGKCVQARGSRPQIG